LLLMMTRTFHSHKMSGKFQSLLQGANYDTVYNLGWSTYCPRTFACGGWLRPLFR
jgi:hypothetical protein